MLCCSDFIRQSYFVLKRLFTLSHFTSFFSFLPAPRAPIHYPPNPPLIVIHIPFSHYFVSYSFSFLFSLFLFFTSLYALKQFPNISTIMPFCAFEFSSKCSFRFILHSFVGLVFIHTICMQNALTRTHRHTDSASTSDVYKIYTKLFSLACCIVQQQI